MIAVLDSFGPKDVGSFDKHLPTGRRLALFDLNRRPILVGTTIRVEYG